LADFESTACEAARRGGEVLRRRFREGGRLRVESKGRHDFVTEVDRESESVVVDLLRARFPFHGILAEEGSAQAGSGGLRWVVDPLDGTTNFIHGVAIFSVSVALEGPDGVLAGAIYDPVHGETFHAHRGGGAKLDGRPIRSSTAAALEDALLATGFPFRELRRLDEYLRSFEAFVRSTAGLRRAGSAALDLAHTACGRYDGFWEIGLSRWDIAAGCLIVTEAGGTVTDPSGGGGYLASGDVVAAGAALHPAIVAVTRSAFR
jgi:myo-inositol-1(or 4)-monophosphatase